MSRQPVPTPIPTHAIQPRATVLHHPAGPWPEITAWVQAQLLDLAHRRTGQRQPTQVRIDVPPAMAQTAARHSAPLLAWLQARQLRVLMLGSRRADVRLEIL